MANGHGGARPGAGRKPKITSVLRDYALEGAPAERALGLIVAVMDNEEAPTALRVQCAIEVMDRKWGKASVGIKVGVDEKLLRFMEWAQNRRASGNMSATDQPQSN